MGVQQFFLFNVLENGTVAEAKGGLGDQTEAAAQAGGGLVPEPQGKVKIGNP
jgi:hypothetical protein